MNEAAVPTWVELTVAALLLVSAVLALASAWGLARLPDFFARMHVPALTTTLGVWCVTIAAVLYFSALEDGLALYYWLIAIVMSITAPITTVLLARAALFRSRQQKKPGVPPPVRLSRAASDDPS